MPSSLLRAACAAGRGFDACLENTFNTTVDRLTTITDRCWTAAGVTDVFALTRRTVGVQCLSPNAHLVSMALRAADGGKVTKTVHGRSAGPLRYMSVLKPSSGEVLVECHSLSIYKTPITNTEHRRLLYDLWLTTMTTDMTARTTERPGTSH